MQVTCVLCCIKYSSQTTENRPVIPTHFVNLMSLLQANKAFCETPTNLDNSLAE